MTYNEAFEYLIDLVRSHFVDKPLVIAIDGRSASGKTTFANKLSESINAPVIHTDDFFRPKGIDGKINISQFDGNFDIERFKLEAVNGMMSGKSFKIGVFDCNIGHIKKKIIYSSAKCYIVEGAFSHNPKLGEYADVKLFFDVSSKEQQKRILERNGIDALRNFQSVWIPAEERYISHYNIAENCDIIIKSTED